MSPLELTQALPYLRALQAQRKRRKIDTYYPEDGPRRRELYPMHCAFFRAGAEYRQRAAIAANRVGKTEGIGAYEVTCHLTGQYPQWWDGRRFSRPVKVWAAGDTGKTVKEILQSKLLGEPGQIGTGMIPGDAVIRTTSKGNVPDAIDSAYIQHTSGGISTLVLKSYEQGRESFQGTEQDVIWLDEEPPLSIYTECLTRTLTTNGLVLLTFTPLQGISEAVLLFLPGGKIKAGESSVEAEGGVKKYVVAIAWDDVPHLDEKAKAELLATYPAFQRDARTKGIPQLGAGAIYPVAESDITVPDIVPPESWPRAFGLDVGWNRTAAVWGAQDPVSKVLYLYSEHYMGKEEPSIHVQAIRGRGIWIPGVIDPASRGRSQIDGRKLIQDYIDLGLKLTPSRNAVEAGLLEVWQLLSGGMLKVCKSLNNWLTEFRIYRRDENGRVVKENDHLMDATRYLILSGRQRMICEPQKTQTAAPNYDGSYQGQWS